MAKPTVIFIWANFGPYHVDRLEAAAAVLSDTHHVVGIEVAGSSGVYPWDRTEQVMGAERITLFPGRLFESVPMWRQFLAMVRACSKLRGRYVFLCHFVRAETYLLAIWLRLTGRHVYVMTESKFDDKPREFWREFLKKALYLPYQGALAGGSRHRDYLRFLGFNPKLIALGYDTVSINRIQRLAGSLPAPAGISYRYRHFTIVARLVPKKNIGIALNSYASYVRAAGGAARELHICGSGELESELRTMASDLKLEKVKFRGFVQAPEIARVLAATLALILPSTEEQWGLVINEALALGVPILCSSNVGARDLLVRTGVNGFVFEPDNPSGLAYFMQHLANDEGEWRSLAEGSLTLSSLADTRHFGAGVAQLLLGQRAPVTGTVSSVPMSDSSS